MERRIGSQPLKYRWAANLIAAVDIVLAIGTLSLHTFTIFTQELRDESTGKGTVYVPLTPVQLKLHGYLLVMAWIGIIAVNLLQLCIAFSLFRASSSKSDATKGLSGCRIWLKTAVFLLILNLFKLVILYFMSEMGSSVMLSVAICCFEVFARIVGIVLVIAFLQELTSAYPDISQIYFEAEANIDTSPKRNPVTDAVWF